MYSEIRYWKNGKIEVVNKGIDSGWLNQYATCSTGYSFTVCKTEELEKKKKKFFDKLLKEVNKEVALATKKRNALISALIKA